MAWNREQWLRDVFPGEEKIYSEYRLLPRRELAVVAGAIFDSALADLIAKRFRDVDGELHEFLGVNGDGRAPCGSFGARIQFAFLLRIITRNDMAILRGVKNVRNRLAHEVNADYNRPPVLPLMRALNEQLAKQSNALIDAGHLTGSKQPRGAIFAFWEN
jgi:hypothetical protein